MDAISQDRDRRCVFVKEQVLEQSAKDKKQVMHHLTLIQRAGQQWGNLAYRKSFRTFSSSAGLRLCPLTLQTCEASIFFFSPELFRFGECTQSKTQQTHMLDLIYLYMSPWLCLHFIHQSPGSALDNHKLNGIQAFRLSLSSYFGS